MFCSEFFGRVIWVSSTTRCHTLVATFPSIHYYSEYHTRRDMLLYLPKSAYPGLFHPVEFPCVWAAPSSISGSSLRGVVTRFFVCSSNCYSFWGGRRFQHKARHPPQELPYFSENLRPAPPPHRRWQTRSRVLPDQPSHDCILNFKLRSRPPA
jgi:hypothetical protein